MYQIQPLAEGHLSGLNLSHAEQKSQKTTHGVLETEDNSPKGLGPADEVSEERHQTPENLYFANLILGVVLH